tara:strand:+ start:222 stop:554 length:333 start_codon:yes stop_codon:yes gene_type:complete
MEEIEVSNWMTLNALKDEVEIVDTVGNLQSGSLKSIFCTIEEDCMELLYSDTGSNFIRRFEDKEEFQSALEKRKEEIGETPFEKDPSFNEDFEGEEAANEDNYDEGAEKF